MERRDLISQIRDAANDAALEFTSLRNTGGHEVFSLGGLRIPIPNHREIAEGTATETAPDPSSSASSSVASASAACVCMPPRRDRATGPPASASDGNVSPGS